MDDFPSYEQHLVNLNSATIAGQVKEWKPVKIDEASGKITAMSFTLSYEKQWLHGKTQTIPIRCYVTGQERVEKLSWLKPGEWALAHGEVTDKGAVYAYQVEWLSRPARAR